MRRTKTNQNFYCKTDGESIIMTLLIEIPSRSTHPGLKECDANEDEPKITANPFEIRLDVLWPIYSSIKHANPLCLSRIRMKAPIKHHTSNQSFLIANRLLTLFRVDLLCSAFRMWATLCLIIRFIGFTVNQIFGED